MGKFLPLFAATDQKIDIFGTSQAYTITIPGESKVI
jgi:hypothetical protein